ncbi:MAG: hypothetical protein M0P71_16930 [Melioribacteraceae bacterium]|nr:hypothetical protein [Melioribacteraceae bacterium]
MKLKQLDLVQLSGYITGVGNVYYLPVASGIYLEGLITGAASGSFLQVSGSQYIINPDLSGIGGLQVIRSGNSTILFSGAPNTSGDLTGAFYPLYANPSNYVTSGDITNTSGVLSGQIHSTGESLLALINAVSGQSPLNVVYTTGNQTISGQKNFVDLIAFNGTRPFLASGFSMPTIILDNNGYFYDYIVDLGINLQSGYLSRVYGIPNLSWKNQQLSGNWSTNTFPSLSGHLINKGYLDSVSGAFGANTGVLTGSFYPLNSNPSGYIIPAETGQFVSIAQTGQFVSTSATGNFITTAQTGAFYSINNPSGYTILSNLRSTWVNLSCSTITNWTTNPLTFEDKAKLALSGTSTLNISGLYDGWMGVLQTVQSGSGFNLLLPSGTKVANNGSGIVYLTTGISGAIDTISFAYDGTNLFANIGNRWT